MVRLAVLASALIVAGLATSAQGQMQQHSSDQPMHHAEQTESMEQATCGDPVDIVEEAEHQPGGAHYMGHALKLDSKHREAAADMKGAHSQHKPKRGGTFFMAPNKLHHLEDVYSDDCGFRLYFYNAFTKPIHANRFQAFIKVIPRGEDQFEIWRFLSPSKDGADLRTEIGGQVAKPFTVDLYVKVPENEEPELFNIPVAGTGH